MVTLFHTFLHFVTLFCTILSPTACAAASTRKPGVSKSHLLSDFHTYTHIDAYNTNRCSGAYTHYSPQDSYCMGMLAQ